MQQSLTSSLSADAVSAAQLTVKERTLWGAKFDRELEFEAAVFFPVFLDSRASSDSLNQF